MTTRNLYQHSKKEDEALEPVVVHGAHYCKLEMVGSIHVRIKKNKEKKKEKKRKMKQHRESENMKFPRQAG